MGAAMAKRTIGENEWTIISVNGTVSVSAELSKDTISEMSNTIGLAQALGMTTDVCTEFSDEGFAGLTFQFDAKRVDTLDILLSLLVD
jgi:hypothetical protein